jgi:uncharacterized coiled-coil protein SlyX
MQIDTLNKKTSILADLRRTKDILSEEIDNQRAEFEKTIEGQSKQLTGLKNKIAEVQETILEELRKDKLFTWKTEDATISRKITSKYVIQDEEALIIDLNNRGLGQQYTQIKVKPEVKTLFDTGDFVGVEKVETDFISVIVRKVDGK